MTAGKQMVKSLDAYAREIGEWRKSKEFYTPDARQFNTPVSAESFHAVDLTHADALLGKLMLVVTEISEAAEAVRKHDYENFCEEITDAFIRLMDIVDASGIPIRQHYEDKMDKNRARLPKHGKKTNL